MPSRKGEEVCHSRRETDFGSTLHSTREFGVQRICRCTNGRERRDRFNIQGKTGMPAFSGHRCEEELSSV